MASCAAKNYVRKVGMGEARETTSTGGGRSQGVGKFLQGGGASNSIVWVGNVYPLGVNGKEDRGDEHGVTVNDNGEESEAIKIWAMGDAGGRRHTRGSGNPVGYYLHRVTAGNRGSVGKCVEITPNGK